MEDPNVLVPTATELRIATPDSPSMIRSTMSTPKSPSESSDDREAPECKCAICLGRLRNKSLIDSCFHEFCFECLVEWSKVKAECPLCKTKFEYIIHNVRSNDDYEKYHCQNNQQDGDMRIPWTEDPNRSFRYRTTMTPRLQERLAVQQIVAVRERSTGVAGRTRSWWSQTTVHHVPEFRSRVYRENLWVQPLSDVTNRFRECSPAFYRENPAQVYRLARWLERELLVLLPVNCPNTTCVMHTIINNVFQHPIRSPFFATQLRPYLGANTRHFIHEFAEFARSPFDIGGHDRAATYLPHGPAAIEEVVLNSPTISDLYEDNLDELLHSSGSDVEIIESNSVFPSAPVAGPSGVSRTSTTKSKPRKRSSPIRPLSNEEMHEIISSSSSDDCEVIGVFKPPTPEIIDILSGDEETQQVDDGVTSSHSVEHRSPHLSGDRLVNHLDVVGTPNSQSERTPRTPDLTSPRLLEENVDRPRLIVKIEPGRIKQKLKRRQRDSDSWGSSSSSEQWPSVNRRRLTKRWDWSESSSDSAERHGRIPSVVVPQPNFKVEASSSRLNSSYDDASIKREEEHRERSKRKKSRHSKKHKRSRRIAEDEEWGEGTSGSSSSRRCKVCRHKHCMCNRDSSSKHLKRTKSHHREVVEEWESASGSSRSRSKVKKHSKFKYSDSRCSDSSG